MSEYLIKEVNAETGEEIVREATELEITELEALKESFEAEQAKKKADEAKRQAILDRLGLSAEEAKLLLS